MLVAYTIPSVVLLVPLLVIFRTYGLINTHLGMILAEATHSAPFVLLLLINYFSTLPRELDDAARVDGCSRLGALWRIVLPLSVPGTGGGRSAGVHHDLEQLPVRVPVHDHQQREDAAGDDAAVRGGRARRVGHQRRRRGADARCRSR